MLLCMVCMCVCVLGCVMRGVRVLVILIYFILAVVLSLSIDRCFGARQSLPLHLLCALF